MARIRRSSIPAVPCLLTIPAILLLGLFCAALALGFLEVLRPTAGEAPGNALDRSGTAGHATYFAYAWRSAILAAAAAMTALILGYPVALWLKSLPSIRWLLFGFLILAFFSDYALRVAGLTLAQVGGGIANHWQHALKAIDVPKHPLLDIACAIVGLTAASLPVTILCVSRALSGLNPVQIDSARLLGASRWQAFRTITLPLSVPGLVGGAILAFLLSLNLFVAPTFLGGGVVEIASDFITGQGNVVFEPQRATAASMILLVLALVLVGLSNVLFARFGRRFGMVPRR